jgi:autoinducer 2-degrading protein
MLVVLVQAHVKVTAVNDFVEATLRNAQASLAELGVARFDVIQQLDDPTRFVLVEAYRSPEGAAAHKETAHYLQWRDRVAPLMEEPRSSIKYGGVFPSSEDW